MPMTMAMMQIGVVGMPVHQTDMPMPVRVWFVWLIARTVLMLVMCIVTMPVLMFHRIVDVVVFMLFGQVQPKTQAHEAACDEQL
jgi:hypothetical protein